VQIAATQKAVSESYLSVFENTDFLVQSLEIEAQAISRSVVKKGDNETYMIVDFGEKRTGIFIISEGEVAFTSTFSFGGITLSKMMQKSFNISLAEAEKMKKQYGLQRNLDNKEIFPILLNGVSVLRDEIAKHLQYWNRHKDDEHSRTPVKKVLLCGGSSNIIGLSDYLSVSLKTKVEIANAWLNIRGKGNTKIPKIELHKSLSFATAVGLALGDFYDD